MKPNGIVFDLNGTLLYDTPIQMKAWQILSEEIRGYPFSDREFIYEINGLTNGAIFSGLMGRVPSADELKKLVERKESLYWSLMDEYPEKIALARGAEELLDKLTARGIPFSMATAAGAKNMGNFKARFNLGRWFDDDRIVSDDGTLPGKPEPDVYLKAMELIGVKPEDCIVMEDTAIGIQSAVRAGVAYVVALAPYGEPPKKIRKMAQLVVADFHSVDIDLLLRRLS